MRHSEDVTKIAPAYVKAQAAVEGAKKDARNDGFKRNGEGSAYATLTAVFLACKEAVAANDIGVFQTVDGENMITRLWHSSGQWMEGETPLLVGKKDMQGLGSAMTYARRFGLMAAMGIAPEDDDGNAAAKDPPKDDATQQQRRTSSGPLNLTDLRKFMHSFSADLDACEDLEMYEALRATTVPFKGQEYPVKNVLAQVMRDFPDHWNGTPDQQGLKADLGSKKTQLEHEAREAENMPIDREIGAAAQ